MPCGGFRNNKGDRCLTQPYRPATGTRLKMVGPISDDLADMTVGIFTSGRGITDLAQNNTVSVRTPQLHIGAS